MKQAAAAKIKAQKDADAKAEADRKAALAKRREEEATKQPENLRLEAVAIVKEAENYARANNYKQACSLFKKAAIAGNEDAKTYLNEMKPCRNWR